MAILSREGVSQGVLAQEPKEEIGIRDLYRAFSGAETEAFNDPWIRTTFRDAKGGSTAYGPVQLTGSLVKNYLLNKPEVVQNKEFANRYLQQSREFSKHGNNIGKIPYFNPTYDYGGSGNMNNPHDQAGYGILSKEIMGDLWQNAKKKDNPLDTMIGYWRWGEGSKNTRADDPEYFKRFYKHLIE